MCENTIKWILENKIVVIVRGVEKEKLIPLAQAMYDGGIRLIEITFDATKKVTDEETGAMIKMLAENFEGKMLVGAGTVLTKEQVDITKAAGGMFIISPDANVEVIKYTKENFHAKMVTIKDGNDMDLTETEDIKKRWQE